MTRKFTILGGVRPWLVAFGTSAVMTFVVAGAAYAQVRGHHPMTSSGGDQSAGSGGGRSSGSGQGSQAEPSSPPPPRASHERPESSTGGDSGRSGHAVQRGDSNSGSNGGSSGGGKPGAAVTRDNSGDSSGSGSNPVPPYSRPRNGRNAIGEAVDRPPNSTGGGTTVVVTNGGYGGGFYPWGYGGLGFGSYYGGGYYDPWYDGYGSGYGGSSYGYGYGYDGALKLKVKPRDASVYVDGYFAGPVDEFDGIFQRLRIESGPHRVEVRLDGYEPLTFEVRIQPDRTVTYRGELKKLP